MKNLKKRRLKAGLSQMALALKSGMGRYNIGLAENGQRQLTKGEKSKILLALKGASSENKNKKK